MTDEVGGRRAFQREIGDLAIWLALSAVGLATVWLVTDHGGAGTVPFLARYRLVLLPVSLLAPAVAVTVLVAAARRRVLAVRRFGALQALAYLAALAWTGCLAVVDGIHGLTDPLTGPDRFLADAAAVGDHPLAFLRHFTDRADGFTTATRGHPPGPVLLLWALRRIGLHGELPTALLLTAIGALFVPFTLAAVRSVCGDLPARRYAPLLVLAPYAVFVAGSMDAVVAALGAAMIAAGARATGHHRTGVRSAGWALLAGLLLGAAALFSYAAPWLGLALVFLYFARRRPLANVATGLGALVLPLLAAALGFSWFDGLLTAHADYLTRVAPYRSVLLWAPFSLLTLLVASGPAFVASMRKLRNTPGWPFLSGAAVAVAFSIGIGLARAGVETAWLPFFGWLSVAATAPERQAGPPVPAPLLLTAAGAVAGILIKAVLSVG